MTRNHFAMAAPKAKDPRSAQTTWSALSRIQTAIHMHGGGSSIGGSDAESIAIFTADTAGVINVGFPNGEDPA